MEEVIYNQPSQEIIDQIRGMFDISCYQDTDFKFETRENGYYINVSQEYYYVNFKDDISILQGMMAICQLLGVKDGDEWYRKSSQGCETCGFGSEYTIEWRFW